MFSALAGNEMERLLEGVQFCSLKAGAKVFVKGEKMSRFAIIVEGGVVNSKK